MYNIKSSSFRDSNNQKITIVVPTLNEEQNIGAIVNELVALKQKENLNIEIVVIDDNSTDDTYNIALCLKKQYPFISVYKSHLHRGFGNVVRVGLEKASGQMAVICCADLVDPIETIPQMVRLINEGNHLVLLSRRINNSDDNSPLKFKIYQFGFRWLVVFLLGVDLKDTTYSYRCLDLRVLKNLALESPGFELSPEITLKACLLGYKIAQVTGTPKKRVAGVSKFSFLKAGRGYPRVLLKAFVCRLTGIWFGRSGKRLIRHIKNKDAFIRID